MSFDSGAKLVRSSGGPISFYENYTTTNLYVTRVFGGNVNTITVSNDSATDTVNISYDGATLEAELLAGESITLDVSSKTSVDIKGVAGGGGVRIWGW